MTPSPLPPDVWDTLPVEVRALIDTLRAEVAALRARLDTNPQNSSSPPSSDPPHIKRQPPRPPTKRGGQPGHQRSVRPMAPPEQLSRIVECVPGVSSCGTALAGTDPTPHLHQVAELLEVRPDVVEYRLHRLTRPRCGKATRGELPAGMPRGAFGPRPLATIALLTGRYRLSKRLARAALGDLLGLSVSVGMLGKAERPADAATIGPVEEVARAIATSPASNVDETGWRQGRKRAWLWAAVGPGMTLFRVDRSRGADALRRLVGEAITPVVTSDRFPTYKAGAEAAGLLGPSSPRLPGDDRPGRRRAGGRGHVAGPLRLGLRLVAAQLGVDPPLNAAGLCRLAAAGGPAQL